MNLYRYIFALLLALTSFGLQATHNRAGEITYKYIGGYTYEVTVITYTKVTSQIDRCELSVEWGDNTSSVLPRINGSVSNCAPAHDGEVLGNDIRRNVYQGTHTFPSPGYFTISVEDLNRNSGVANINNSVQVPFYVSTTLLVNPAIGPNNSPILLNYPIDEGCIDRMFVHNAGAFDPDGDSLSFELVNCRGLNGRELTETYDPNYVQDSIYIDEYTGDLIWDQPRNIGEFNFAFVIKEYRKGLNGNYQLIGSVTRDMQVNIGQCNNRPPTIQVPTPHCVEAGSTLNFNVIATDPDNNTISLSATGGPFEVTPSASFPNPSTGPSPVSEPFSWTPSCDQVRFQPYFVYFRAEDIPSNPPSLVGLATVEIRVVAPSPKNPSATPNQDVIDLVWDPNFCQSANGYDIYRRKGSFGFIPSECETGVPEYTGYEKIGSTIGWASTAYTDTNDIERGVQYCYMVVATFDDGSESYASVEFCTELAKTLPIITNVDVRATDAVNGEIEVRWIPALEIDSFAFPPPYAYVVERAPQIDGNNFVILDTVSSTNYIDNGLNTQDAGWNYRITLLSGVNEEFVGTTDDASSLFASTIAHDESIQINFEYLTPWVNDTTVVYRETSQGSGIWDSIGFTTSDTYLDTGLANGTTYCYYGKGIGRFTGSNMPAPVFNRSQEICGEPSDNEAPCVPTVSWSADCENAYLRIDWSVPSGCPSDIVYYNIYYRASSNEPWSSSPIVQGITDPFFIFNEGSIVGCYAITAVDDADEPNESPIVEAFCIDGCAQIELPDVFSPSNDGVNDFFYPVRDGNGEPIFRDIDQFQIKVMNRWGRVVYKTDDINEFVNVGWDGNDRTTNLPCPEGVYFYICTYRARSLGNAPEEVLNGSLHLFR
ncbi:MAG: gliding motility-associated C-terminal domain-containing protein [Bacteroidetes bacterium]|nr:MAG: gliding motility-associated C-terminal domain-containing protein [Bacteroidota bacterium]